MPGQNIFWSLNIKYLRSRKKMSQQQMAAELGISRMELHAHEAGRIPDPSLNALLDFSRYFKISADILLRTDLGKLPVIKMQELETGKDVYLTGSKIRILSTGTGKTEAGDKRPEKRTATLPAALPERKNVLGAAPRKKRRHPDRNKNNKGTNFMTPADL